jgi:hypothetical protein
MQIGARELWNRRGSAISHRRKTVGAASARAFAARPEPLYLFIVEIDHSFYTD